MIIQKPVSVLVGDGYGTFCCNVKTKKLTTNFPPKASWPHRKCYLLVSASTPGSFLPSRNSRLAPPPVEMWVILSATPA